MSIDPSYRPVVIADWPLVGRDEEVRELVGLLIHHRRSLVLAGPAGVGKSRLASELIERCKRAGFATERITATAASASLPFGALAPVLPPFDAEAVGRVDDKAELLRRTAVGLVERAAPRRLVFFVDDAHLLDAASATLVHQLVTTESAVVIATVRSGEPAPDPIVALWKDGLADRRDLTGLSSIAVGELLTAVLSGLPDPNSVAELMNRSGGNVLFLKELVIGAQESKTLRNDGGVWRLNGPLVASERLTEIVGARLGRLSVDELSFLELIAVGEPLGAAELSALGNPEIAEHLERKRLLSIHVQGSQMLIRFAHPLYGDYVRNQMPALRRRALARELADAAEQRGTHRQDDLLRIATWRLEGGGGDPELMCKAASMARWHYDFDLAEQLVNAAIDMGSGFDARLLQAQLASLQGRGEEAETQFAGLEADCADEAQRGAVALSRIDNMAFYLGRPAEGVRLAEESEASISAQNWRDQIRARRSALVFALEGPAAGAAVAVPVVSTADSRALVWAAQVAAFTLGRMGQIDEGLDAAARGYEAHLKVEEPLDWYPWTHLFFRGELLAFGGRIDEAEALAEQQYASGLDEHSPEAQAWFMWLRASLVGERGDVNAAAQFGRQAAALFRELGRPQFEAFSLTYLTLALALGGRADDAAASMQRFDDLATADLFMGVDPIQARAWTSVAAGDLPRARSLLRDAAANGDRIGDYVGRSTALHGLARLGRAREVYEDLEREAGRIQGPLVRARADHARALAKADVDALERAATAFEALSAFLLAAEAAADAAVLHRKAGNLRAATTAERLSQTLADRCPGAVTPSLSAVGPRAFLSPAERDTALLAVAGRSNKEIAQELSLSVRTVEGRLQRVYTRLGVGGRSELAEALEINSEGEQRPS